MPEENLVEPPLHIIGPTIEASKFYFESDELRSMFSNLIAASIDSETINKTHPAFV
ncbi:Abi-alpha family protein, partial [Bacillus haynesii]|uniref:Abi-alpha family protein n=1 Tax=Bacillus haynesii TaxID=1925021 RepID=UPI00399096C8